MYGDALKDVETRVDVMLRERIIPEPEPLYWHFPTNLIYNYYNPRY